MKKEQRVLAIVASVFAVGLVFGCRDAVVAGASWPRFVPLALMFAAGASAISMAERAIRRRHGLEQRVGALVSLAAQAAKAQPEAEVGLAGDDEVAQVAISVTLLGRRLRAALMTFSESTERVSSAATHLSELTRAQTETVTRQAAALQETQVTAQEIKQTAELAAERAEAMIKHADRSETISGAGERAVVQSVASLNDIHQQVLEIAQRIEVLNERTRQIGDITQSVKDLADQSNMLALNAAIEAVRSGEAGKGFAVVAREIRSLADQSIEATKRVREILEDVGRAIHSAVAITGTGMQRIEAGLVQVKASGENLQELSSIVRETSASMRQIAAAVSQQGAGILQIFGAVREQNEMMDETVRKLHATHESAEQLKEVSQTMIESILAATEG